MDGSELLREEDFRILARLTDRPFFLVINKTDLPQCVDAGSIKRQAQAVLSVSAKTTQGIEALKQALFEEYGPERLLENEQGLVTSVRQERSISESLVALSKGHKSLTMQMPHEVVLLDLYSALRSLNTLTGETTIEDILGNIFSTFCIGK